MPVEVAGRRVIFSIASLASASILTSVSFGKKLSAFILSWRDICVVLSDILFF
jgi:hypothetical protein